MKKSKTVSKAVCAAMTSLLLSACSSAPTQPESMRALPECGWLPNCVNTLSGTGIQSAQPLQANASQWQDLKAWFADQPGWKVLTDDNNFMQLTFTTPTMGFVDDVQLLYIPVEQLIQVRSSSRLGISDMGANAARVESLRTELNKLGQ